MEEDGNELPYNDWKAKFYHAATSSEEDNENSSDSFELEN